MRSVPPATVIVPAQVGFEAVRTKVPLSFLVRVFVVAESVKGAERVRALPDVTSKALFAWFKMNVRADEKLAVARKPMSVVPSTFRRTLLPVLPRAASELAARTPARTSIVAVAPPKVFAGFVSSSVPAPDLVRS